MMWVDAFLAETLLFRFCSLFSFSFLVLFVCWWMAEICICLIFVTKMLRLTGNGFSFQSCHLFYQFISTRCMIESLGDLSSVNCKSQSFWIHFSTKNIVCKQKCASKTITNIIKTRSRHWGDCISTFFSQWVHCLVERLENGHGNLIVGQFGAPFCLSDAPKTMPLSGRGFLGAPQYSPEIAPAPSKRERWIEWSEDLVGSIKHAITQNPNIQHISYNESMAELYVHTSIWIPIACVFMCTLGFAKSINQSKHWWWIGAAAVDVVLNNIVEWTELCPDVAC